MFHIPKDPAYALIESTELVMKLQAENESMRQQLAECERELGHWKGRGTMGQIAQWRSDSEQLAALQAKYDELVAAAKDYLIVTQHLRPCPATLEAFKAALAKVGADKTGEK